MKNNLISQENLQLSELICGKRFQTNYSLETKMFAGIATFFKSTQIRNARMTCAFLMPTAINENENYVEKVSSLTFWFLKLIFFPNRISAINYITTI